MLFNGRTLIFTFSRTQVRIAEHERLQSLFKMSMIHTVGRGMMTFLVRVCCYSVSRAYCEPDTRLLTIVVSPACSLQIAALFERTSRALCVSAADIGHQGEGAVLSVLPARLVEGQSVVPSRRTGWLRYPSYDVSWGVASWQLWAWPIGSCGRGQSASGVAWRRGQSAGVVTCHSRVWPVGWMLS